MSTNSKMTSEQLQKWFNSIREPRPYQQLKPRGYKNTCTSEVIYIPQNNNSENIQEDVVEVTDKLRDMNLEDNSTEDKPLLNNTENK